MQQAIDKALYAKQIARMQVQNINLKDAYARLQNELESQRKEMSRLSDEKETSERKH